MGAVLGLLLGTGLVLIASAYVVPREARRSESNPEQRRLADLLVRAGMPQTRPRTVVALAVVAAAIGFVAVQALSGAAPVALVFAMIAGQAPFAVLRGRARRRQRELAEVWPEAVDHLASGIRAGLSLPEALSGLATRGPEALRPAFATFSLDYQVSGRFTDALDRLKGDLADPVGDWVVEAFRVAREVGGGDLGRLLRTLSGFLRDDARTRSELEARQAWAVNGARLAISAPWLVLLLLSFQREVIARYATPAGAAVLMFGVCACAAAYWMMLRIGRLPTERRTLG